MMRVPTPSVRLVCPVHKAPVGPVYVKVGRTLETRRVPQLMSTPTPSFIFFLAVCVNRC